jgi:DNA-binding response OmpR family regulator
LTGSCRREYTFWQQMSPPWARLAPSLDPGRGRLPTEVGSVSTGRAEDYPPGGRILVVDDEPDIGGLIERVLSASGYQVSRARDGREGLDQALAGGYGLVILDLIMPVMSGPEVLARLPADQPVLVLSCVSDVITKVDCLDLGARDYLTKPFQIAELLARVRARLRDGPPASPADEVIRSGSLRLDMARLEADAGTGPVALTRLEFLLLRQLMDHPGQAVAKERLLASVWGLEFDPRSNVVDVCVRRLRSKLGFDLIRTVHGAGYQLAA